MQAPYTRDPVARRPATPAGPAATAPVEDPLARFTQPVAAWFRAAFAAPTRAQVEGWAAIAAGGHVLIHAPTGSGKTLAAFLWGTTASFALLRRHARRPLGHLCGSSTSAPSRP